MNPVLLYLLKSVACSALFFLYYLAALRNRRFHSWNRFYLLASVLASLAIPLLHWTVSTPATSTANVPVRLLHVAGTANAYFDELTAAKKASFSIGQGLMLAYAAVSFALLLSFLYSLWRIVRLVRTHPSERIGNTKLVHTDQTGTPFTFFRCIFWNDAIDRHSANGARILRHERTHADDGHSWDSLFLQVVLMACWCNPFFWLIRRELKQVHEFIADERAAGTGDGAVLAAMILQATYPRQYSQLVHPFFQSSIKRRLGMLTKNSSRKLPYLGRLLGLPVLAAAITAFTVRTATGINTALPLDRIYTVVIDAGHGLVSNAHTGAHAGDAYEDNIVLALARKVQALNTDRRLRIILTRTDAQAIDLKKRVEIAAQSKADYFISLHVNMTEASSEGRTSGIEVFVGKDSSAHDAGSRLIASAVQQEVETAYKTYPGLLRPVQHVWVLDHNVCPSTLIECGYISDATDRNFITSEKGQELLAQKILAAIAHAAAAK